jgi:molybdopterin molybdotransferase
MRTVLEHRAAVLALGAALEPVRVPTTAGRGLVLAEAVTSRLDLPGFDNSAMDGYAVRVADCVGASPDQPIHLPVTMDIAAGDTRRLRLEPGAVARIMTGAPVPEGAEAIVPVEDTDGGAETVAIRAEAQAGRHIRGAGEDVVAGAPIVPAGTVLSPGVIALLAAANVAEVAVHRRPRVTVFSTGDELVDLGGEPGFGQIIDSNQVMLGELVRAAGCEVAHVGRLVDEPAPVRAAFADPPGDPDLVLTSGGVSMGAHDTVKEVLTETGTVSFVKVAMRPGMPQGSGTIGGSRAVPVVTLPGNPVSSFVSFHVFVLPLLQRLAGLDVDPDDLTARCVEAVAADDWHSVPGKVEFTRVTLAGGRAAPARGQGSHMVGALAGANALAVVPEDVDHVRAGDVVHCLPLLGTEATP